MNIAADVTWTGLVPVPPSSVSLSYTACVAAPTAMLGYRIDPPTDSMRTILEHIALHYGLSVEALKGPCRARQVAWPRQEAMWLMHKTGRYSLPQIGRFLGYRDHTTVLHGIRRHQARVDKAAADLRYRAA